MSREISQLSRKLAATEEQKAEVADQLAATRLASEERLAQFKNDLLEATTSSNAARREAESYSDRTNTLEQELETVLTAHWEGTSQGEVVASALEREMDVAMQLRSRLQEESSVLQRISFEHEQATVTSDVVRATVVPYSCITHPYCISQAERRAAELAHANKLSELQRELESQAQALMEDRRTHTEQVKCLEVKLSDAEVCCRHH